MAVIVRAQLPTEFLQVRSRKTLFEKLNIGFKQLRIDFNLEISGKSWLINDILCFFKVKYWKKEYIHFPWPGLNTQSLCMQSDLVYELNSNLRSRHHILRQIYFKICKINPIRVRNNLAYIVFIFNNVLRFLPTLTT